MSRKVVITGLGTVTPLGTGFYPLWEALVAGKSALGPLTSLDPAGFPSRLGGEIKGFSARDFMPKAYRKSLKVMARDIEIAVGAAKLAVDDANLVTRAHAETGQTQTTYPSERVGCQIGAGLIAAEAGELAAAMATAVPAGVTDADRAFNGGFSLKAWGTQGDTPGSGGMNNLPPLWMLKYLPNMLACHVTIIHGNEGPSNTITCAEASGLLCIGEGSRVIERGAADATFAGGADSKLNVVGFLRWTQAGDLADTGAETDGSRIVRPYDPQSPGTLMSEGGGILILEEASSAAARGARVYAEIAGFGAAQSSPPVLPPYPNGRDRNDGLERAIAAALRDAGIGAEAIDAIVPQAKGAPAFDAGEAQALRRVFGARLSRLPLVTLAPAMGDLYAGYGAVQAGVAAMCLREQRVPARIHAGRCPGDLRAEAGESREATLNHVLVCASSMGGQNAALVLRKAS
ncbi:3-oxoacyl-[acyl-carrier-protein] synthase II [Phycisphaerales bacterium]|nr:3-oxoacyl-[acyl-carrier-protein] synthase II [Phycisphaerales bacterium]